MTIRGAKKARWTEDIPEEVARLGIARESIGSVEETATGWIVHVHGRPLPLIVARSRKAGGPAGSA